MTAMGFRKIKYYKFSDKELAVRLANKEKEKIIGKECEKCKGIERLEMHHPNYKLALEITTLCMKCHHKLHNKRIK